MSACGLRSGKPGNVAKMCIREKKTLLIWSEVISVMLLLGVSFMALMSAFLYFLCEKVDMELWNLLVVVIFG